MLVASVSLLLYAIMFVCSLVHPSDGPPVLLTKYDFQVGSNPDKILLFANNIAVKFLFPEYFGFLVIGESFMKCTQYISLHWIKWTQRIHELCCCKIRKPNFPLLIQLVFYVFDNIGHQITKNHQEKCFPSKPKEALKNLWILSDQEKWKVG